MSGINQNEYGQGASHASAPSKVPEGVQRQAPQGLEESLPDSVGFNPIELEPFD